MEEEESLHKIKSMLFHYRSVSFTFSDASTSYRFPSVVCARVPVGLGAIDWLLY